MSATAAKRSKERKRVTRARQRAVWARRGQEYHAKWERMMTELSDFIIGGGEVVVSLDWLMPDGKIVKHPLDKRSSPEV